MLHPLINPESSHYDGEVTTIEKMEDVFTVMEMISFCKVNIFKYEDRKERKGQFESDVKKIMTYKNYMQTLSKLQICGYGMLKVNKAMTLLGLKFEYKTNKE